jgi:hypothetical protein
VRAGSLILAPADGGLEASRRATAAQEEVGKISQVLVNLQAVEQFDEFEHLGDLPC